MVKKIIYSCNINILLFLLFIILLFFPIEFYNDSNSYINNSYRRPFLYPLIIDFFQFFFNKNYLFFLKIFQIFFGFFCIYIFINFYKKKISSSFFETLVVLLILLIPFFHPSMKVSNSILSESIAYPLFILLSKKIINYIITDYQSSDFKKILVILFFLISTRYQFIFFFPLIIFLGLFIKYSVKKKITYFFQIIFTLLLINLFQLVYNYYNYSYFNLIRIGSFQFIAIPYFVSNEDDLKKIRSSEQSENLIVVKNFLLSQSYDKKENSINTSSDNFLSFIKNLRHNYKRFYKFYIPISHAFEHEIIADKKLNNFKDKQFFDTVNFIEKNTFNLSIKLILLSPIKYLLLYLSNVFLGMGSYFLLGNDFKGLMSNIGVFGSEMMIINILIIIVGLKNFLLKKKTVKKDFLFIFAIINILHIMFISIFEPPYDRYIFYTNILFLVFIFRKINTYNS